MKQRISNLSREISELEKYVGDLRSRGKTYVFSRSFFFWFKGFP